jgi:3-isopropylmalate/(R)-2-methylmalate dehydratase small subunit
MPRFTRLQSIVAPFPEANIDTDQILPARFLHKERRDGFGSYLFHDLRFRADGSENEGFVLNQAPYRDARIFAAAQNFGCGSSRENAVWALYDYGVRAVIAPSFGDIFYTNCLKNGLLPVVLPAGAAAVLLAGGQSAEVDLESQTVTLPDGTRHGFEIDPFARHCLLHGIDELDYTLSRLAEIEAFERRNA